MLATSNLASTSPRIGGFLLAVLVVLQFALPVILVYGALLVSFGVLLPQLGAFGALVGFLGMFLVGARLTSRTLRFFERA
jgi:hypothetical protein